MMIWVCGLLTFSACTDPRLCVCFQIFGRLVEVHDRISDEVLEFYKEHPREGGLPQVGRLSVYVRVCLRA